MELTLRRSRYGFAPPGLAAIRHIPDELWTHGQQSLLHPRTAYSRAIGKVTTAWLNALASLDVLTAQMRFGQPVESARAAAERYAHLLQVLNEHVETCYAVMRCLGSPPADDGLWHRRVALRQGLVGLSTFDEQVNLGYRKRLLGEAANLLKHGDSRINLIAMRSGFAFTLGYFLDGPLPGGAIGPNLRLHPDGNSAFSFNRDMLLHWWWFLRASTLMSNVILSTAARSTRVAFEQGHRSSVPHADAEPVPVEAETASTDSPRANAGSFDELCRRMAEIRADFFVDEVEQPFPTVRLDRSSQLMRLRFPAGRRGNPIIGQPAFSAILTVDDVGLNYKLPYFGSDASDGATAERKA